MKKKLPKIGILIFPFILPLSLPLNISAAGVILFMFTALINYNKPFSLEHLKKNRIINLVGIYIAFFIVDIVFSVCFRGEFLYREVKLLFLLLPLTFIISSEFIRSNYLSILRMFVLGQIIYIVFAVLYMIYFFSYLTHEKFAINYYLRYSLTYHLPYAIHHTYLGLNILISIIIVSNWAVFKRIRYLIIGLLFFASFFLSSKLLIVMTCLYAVYKLFIKSRLSILIFGSGILFAYFFYDYSWILQKIGSSYSNRMNIWECAILLLKDNYILGVGNDNIKGLVNSCNMLAGYNDTHNIWLQAWLSNGIIEVAILIIIFFILIKKGLKNKLLLLFTIITLSVGMIEHIFNLQRGVMFFTFFSLMLLIKEEKTITNYLHKNEQDGKS